MSKLTQPTAFFDALRSGKLLGPSLDQDEVNGLTTLTNACGAANWPVSFVAYALATAYHETGHTMQPIAENGGNKYFTRMYDVTGNRPDLAKANGNTSPGDGTKYRGRGYVQLTWKNNYAKAQRICNIPGLVDNPDLAMDPTNAAKILIAGMGDGWFTGKSCKSYLPVTGDANLKQFMDARRIINGQDKADAIASYALDFQNALNKGGWR
jgi:putative chitinase